MSRPPKNPPPSVAEVEVMMSELKPQSPGDTTTWMMDVHSKYIVYHSI